MKASPIQDISFDQARAIVETLEASGLEAVSGDQTTALLNFLVTHDGEEGVSRLSTRYEAVLEKAAA